MPDQQPATGPWRYFGGLVQNAPRPQARTMLRDLFGRGSRDRSRPDTAAVAQALGVTQRSVQRWVHDNKLPAARREQLQAQWDDSPAGRKRRISPTAQRLFRSGTEIAAVVHAKIQISEDRRNGKDRYFTLTFDPHDASALMDAMLAGDDAEAERIWEKEIEGGFGGGGVGIDYLNTAWETKRDRT